MVIILVFFFLSSSLCAKDFGVHGHTYEVVEPNLLKQIESRLVSMEKSGDLAKHNEILKERVKESLMRPKPVSGVGRAQEERVFYYDPSLTVPYDMKDHLGQTFHPAGTRVNPMAYRTLSKILIFINGDDKEQVDWVLSNFDLMQCKIILISGSPYDLMDQIDHPVFFDQEGRLTHKFSIKAVPALVEQEGLQLRISEVVI